MATVKRLMRSRSVRFCRLWDRHRQDLYAIVNAVAWLSDSRQWDIRTACRELAKWIRDAEYGFGVRKRKNRYQRGTVPPGPCVKHADQPGVYIIEGRRYCRACGVTLRRRTRNEGVR